MKIIYTKNQQKNVLKKVQGIGQLSLVVLGKDFFKIKRKIRCVDSDSSALELSLLSVSSCRLVRGIRKTGLLALRIGIFAWIALLVASANSLTPEVTAAPTDELNFQARLQNISGSIVLDGYYNVQFKLYSASSGGTALWTETYYDSNGVTAGNDSRLRVVNGYLTANLGNITSFPGTIDWGEELWLTINVGGTTQTASPTYDGEMSPRIKLTATPFAFKAETANTLTSTDSGFTTTVSLTTPTANNSILFPDDGGTVCLTSGNCSGVAGNTLQQAYAAGNSILATDAEGHIDLTVSEATNFSVDITGSGGFLVKDSGTTVLSINNTGDFLYQSSVDSTTGFQVLDDDGGTPVLNVDTANERVGIGTATPATPLHVVGSTRLTHKADAVLTGTIDPTASKNVTGVGTLFLTELVVGDAISVNGEVRTVTAIASNTSLTVDIGFTDTANDTSPDRLGSSLAVLNNAGALAFSANSDKLYVNKTSTSTTAATEIGQYINFTDTGVVSSGTETTTGLRVDVTRTGATGGTLNTYGGSFSVSGSTAGTSIAIGLIASGSQADISYGVQGVGVVGNVNALTEATGVFGLVQGFLFGSTVTEANALKASLIGDGFVGGTITDYAGLRVETGVANLTTITSNYGIYVENQTVGATDYGIYVEDAADYSLYLASTDNDAASGITFGADTNLYRSAANTLFTNDSLTVDTNLTVNGNATLGNANTDTLTINAGSSGSGITLADSSFANCTLTTVSNVLTCGAGYGDVSSSLTDNTTDALDIQEGTNNYININTTDSSENISFGNSTTNPSYNFLGGGTLSVGGKTALLTSNITIDTTSAFENVLSVGSGATITIDDASAYKGIVFNPTIEYVNPIFITGGRSFEESAILKNPNGVAQSLPHQTGFYANPNIQGDGATFTTNRTAFLDNTLYSVINSGTVTATKHVSFQAGLSSVGAGVTLTDLRGLDVQNAAGSGTVTTQYGVYVGNLTKGTNDYGIYVEGADTYALFVDSGATRLDGTLEVQGLATLTGGLTIEAGDTFTFNTDGFTDFTGGGLVNSSGVLTVDTTTSSGFFQNGGNNFGGNATLGTNGASQTLAFETGGTTRFTVSGAASTLTGSGATTITGGSTLTLGSTTTSALNLDTGTTGTINIGTNTSAKTINLGTGATGVKTINIGGTAANVIGIGNTQTAGSISIGAALTTGTISIGGTGAQTGTISLGAGTGAQTINLGTGGTGAKTVTVGSTASTGTTTIQSGSGGIALTNNTTVAGTLKVNTFATGITAVDSILVPQSSISQLYSTNDPSKVPVALAVELDVDSGADNNHGIAILGHINVTRADAYIGVEGRVDATVAGGSSYGVLGLASLNAADNTGSVATGVWAWADVGTDGVSGTGTAIGLHAYGYGGATNYDAIFGDGFSSGQNSLTAFRGYITDGATAGEVTMQVSDTTDTFVLDVRDAKVDGFDILLNDTAGTAQLSVKDSALATVFSVDSDGNVDISGLLTGNLGATLSGATINLNANSNFDTNINTGTSTGAVSIGNTSAGAITVESASTIGLTGNLTVTGLTSGVALIVNNSTSTGNIFVAQDNGTAVLTVADGGALTLQNSTNSTSALRVNNAAGTAILNVDSTNSRVGIGTATPGTLLDVSGGAANGSYLLRVTNTTSSGEYAVFRDSSNNEQFNFDNTGNGGSQAIKDNSGNVIIRLQAVDTDGEILRLMQPSASAYDAVVILSGGDGDASKIELKEDAGQYGFDLIYNGASNQLELWSDVSTDGNEDLILTVNRNTGALLYQNVTDSTTALQVLDADGGTPILNVDTTNERVGIGTAAPGYKLVVAESQTARTADARVVSVSESGSFDTTSGDLDSYGLYVTNSATISSGANVINKYGVYASATGGPSTTGVYGTGVIGVEGIGVGGLSGFNVGLSGTGSLYGVTGTSTAFTGGVFTGVTGGIETVTTNTSATAGTTHGGNIDVTDTGVVTTGTDTTYGLEVDVTRTGATGGTINTIGADISVVGDTGGTSTVTGLNVNVSGADTNYAAIFQGGNVGVGTATPASALQVTSGNVTVGVATNNNWATGAGDLYVQDEIELDGNLTMSEDQSIYWDANGAGATSYITGTSGDILQIGNDAAAGILQLQSSQLTWQNSSDSYAANFEIDSDGLAFFKPKTDATNSFQVRNSSGTAILNVDSANNQVGVGTSTPAAKLHVQASDITGTGTIAIPAFGGSATGTGTSFTTEVVVGDVIYANSTAFKVLAVNSDTSLTVDGCLCGGAAAGSSYTIRKPIVRFSDLSGTTVFNIDGQGGYSLGASDRTLGLETNTSAGSGYSLVVRAGTASNGTGGSVQIGGGGAGGTNQNGGQVYLSGGVATGTGTHGDVKLAFNGLGQIGTATVGTATGIATLNVGSSISGQNLFKVTDQTATARDVLLIADGGATTFRNQTNSTSGLAVQNAAGTSIFNVDTTNQRVGIGTSGPGVKLHVQDTIDGNILRLQDSDGTCDYDPESGSVTVSCSSDARLKSNIVDNNNSLDYLNSLRIRDYDVIASGDRLTGVIAQETLIDHPELVAMGSDGYYKVQEISSWKIIKGIQEVDDRVDGLAAQIASLQSQLQNQNFSSINSLSANQINVANVSVSQNLSVNGLTTTGSLKVLGTTTTANLVVTGSTTITGNLTVAGTTTVKNLVVDGKITSSGAVPTISNGAVLSVNDTSAIVGNDIAGSITITTSPTSTAVSGEIASVVFSGSYTTAPRVSITAKDAATAAMRLYVQTTTTGFTVHTIDTPTAGTVYEFDYILIE